MAWTSSGNTNAELVDNLRDAGFIKTQSVYDAMLATDREYYVPEMPHTVRALSLSLSLSPPFFFPSAAQPTV